MGKHKIVYGRIKKLTIEYLKEEPFVFPRMLRWAFCTVPNSSFVDFCILNCFSELIEAFSAAHKEPSNIISYLASCSDNTADSAKRILWLLRCWRNAKLSKELRILFNMSAEELIEILTDAFLDKIQAINTKKESL